MGLFQEASGKPVKKKSSLQAVKSIFCTSKGCTMNIEPLVSHAANLMAAATNTGALKLHLCYWEGTLHCHPVCHTSKRHPVLFTFTNEQQLKGFTAAEWTQIRLSISYLTKELESCLSKLHKTTNEKSNLSKT